MRRASPKAAPKSKSLFDQARGRLIRQLQESLKGKLGPGLHPESRESLGELIQLNQLGLLTYDSQQGRLLRGNLPLDRLLYNQVYSELMPALLKSIDEGPWIPPEEYDEKVEQAKRQVEAAYKRRGGRFKRGIVEQERAYVDGILSKELAQPLADWLNQQNNLFATWTSSPPLAQLELAERYAPARVGVTYHLNQAESPFSAFPLTYKSGADLGPNPPSGILEIAGLLPAAKGRQLDRAYVNFQVIDGRYGHSVTEPDGLFKTVAKGLDLVSRNKS